MEFTKTEYNLITDDGRKIIGETWLNGIRYFRIENEKGTSTMEARKVPHRALVDNNLPIEGSVKDSSKSPIAEKIELLEARIAQLENKLDNKLDKVS